MLSGMPRCVAFDPDLSADDTTLTLRKAESHHIVRVLRARPGQAVKVLNGRGLLADTELIEADANGCALKVVSRFEKPAPRIPLTLVLAVIKGKSMDNAIRMATELGVRRIQPVFTQHCDVPLKAFDSGSKIEKWQSVAMEACKQCENPWLPEVCGGTSITTWLGAQSEGDALVYGSLEPGAQDFLSLSKTFQQVDPAPASIAVAIGPEGDFTSEEYQAMRTHGGFAVLLGECILRSETAVPALLAGLIATLPTS